MNRIWTILKQDFVNAIKDNILLFTILIPLILAVGIRLFLPSLNARTVRLALSTSIDKNTINALSSVCSVITVGSDEQLKKIVNRTDNTAGLIFKDEEYTILFQGNEPADFRNIINSIVAQVISPLHDFTFNHITVGKKGSFITEQLTMIMILVGTLLSGMIVGFHMIEDNEYRTILTLAVSPLTFRDYLLARSLAALLLGLLICIPSTFIIYGFPGRWPEFLVSIILSVFVSFSLSFFLSIFASNQITGIGLVKLFLPLFLSIPVISMVIPRNFLWAFTIFPHFWLFVMLENVFFDPGYVFLSFWPSTGFFLITSIALYTISLLLFKRKIIFNR